MEVFWPSGHMATMVKIWTLGQYIYIALGLLLFHFQRYEVSCVLRFRVIYHTSLFGCLQAVFKVFESFDRQYVTVTILRDTSVYDDVLVLEYSTSDLTAEGVDSNKYEECLRLPPMQRGPAKCGDYEQTSGEMTIAAGDDRGTFTVGLVDDLCKEKFVEFIQVL